MHSPVAFGALTPHSQLSPLRVPVSREANERYWQAAGVDHPRLRAGALYPPIAANLTILAFQQQCADAVIQTRQRIVCHRAHDAGADLVVAATIAGRYEKRGRIYVDVHAVVATADAPDDPLWTSEVTFTPVATLGASASA